MKKYIVMLVSTFSLVAMDQDAPPPAYEKCRSLDDVPGYCAHLATQLEAQPVVRGLVWNRVKKYKCDAVDGSLLHDFTQAAAHYLHPSLRWQISGPHRGMEEDFLELRMQDYNAQCEPGSLGMLVATYKRVVKELKENWNAASAQERSLVWSKPRDQAGWELFIQQNGALIGADKLIRSFMYFDPLFNKINCSDRWGTYDHYGPTYLWVKSDAFDAVQSRLNLDIS